jgi:hypothetical protein
MQWDSIASHHEPSPGEHSEKNAEGKIIPVGYNAGSNDRPQHHRYPNNCNAQPPGSFLSVLIRERERTCAHFCALAF